MKKKYLVTLTERERELLREMVSRGEAAARIARDAVGHQAINPYGLPKTMQEPDEPFLLGALSNVVFLNPNGVPCLRRLFRRRHVAANPLQGHG